MRITMESIGFFLLLNLLHLIQDSLACSCMEEHPQNLYCKSEFVIKAKVKSDEQLYGMRRVKRNNVEEKIMYPTYKRYKIRLSKIFKDSPEYENSTKHYIYTSSMDSTCGVQLKNNTKYLLQGRVVSGKPLVSTCDSPIEWHHVSVRQRKGYNYLYEQNCVCKVNVCSTPKCEKKVDRNVCHWNQEQDPGRCYSQHSMCVKRGESGCHWAKTTLLKKCLETVEQDGRLKPQHGHIEPLHGHREPLHVHHESQYGGQQRIEYNHIEPHIGIEP